MIQHLESAAAIPVNGDPFTAQTISQEVSIGDIGELGLMVKIDRFGNRVVRVFLKGGLHPDMLFGAKISSADKDFCDLLGDFFDLLERRPLGELGTLVVGERRDEGQDD